MNTETPKTDDMVVGIPLGWIFYDSECRVCADGRNRIGGIFERRGYRWIPLQTPGTAKRLGLSEAKLREEMRLELRDGRVLSGIDTWIHLWRSVWWLWFLGFFAGLPGIHSIADAAYRWFARNRYCFAGTCSLKPSRRSRVVRSKRFLIPVLMANIVFALLPLVYGALAIFGGGK